MYFFGIDIPLVELIFIVSVISLIVLIVAYFMLRKIENIEEDVLAQSNKLARRESHSHEAQHHVEKTQSKEKKEVKVKEI